MSVIMENEKTKLCKLCFVTCDKNFEVVDNIKRKMLDTVLLELDFSESNEPIICMYCEKNVKKSFNFKLSCLRTEDFINSFSNDKNSDKLDLTKINLNRTGNEDNVNLIEGHTVCRLCMKLIEHDCGRPLHGDTKDAVFFSLHFPEVNLNITCSPVICASCHSSLQDYFDFMNSIAEKKVQRIRTSERVNSDYQHKVNLGTELVLKSTVKCENPYEAKEYWKETDRFEPKHECFMNTEHEEFRVKSEPVDAEWKSVDYDSAPPQPESRVPQSTNKTHLCTVCGVKTRTNYNLQRHMLSHQNSTYECTMCTFKSKYKGNLKKHTMFVHHEKIETDMYRCEVCHFDTNNKYALTRHMLVHQDDSQLTMYHCEQCEYKTKYKYMVARHAVVHNDKSEVRMYHCAECKFKTRHKGSIKYHVLTHKDPQQASKHT